MARPATFLLPTDMGGMASSSPTSDSGTGLAVLTVDLHDAAFLAAQQVERAHAALLRRSPPA